MRVHGFDDKLLDLFGVIFELMMAFRGQMAGALPEAIKEGRFDLCLESYKRQLINGGMKASKLATSLRIRCLRPNSWSSYQKVSSEGSIDHRPLRLALFLTKIVVTNSSKRLRSSTCRYLLPQSAIFSARLASRPYSMETLIWKMPSEYRRKS